MGQCDAAQGLLAVGELGVPALEELASCRGLIDGACRRRSVVEARRTVIAAAARAGIAPLVVARAFGLKSKRPVAEACAWAAREESRDRRFAAILDEVARVGPGA